MKKVEIKNKCLISSQKKLLKFFDELIETIFNNKSVSKIDDNVSVNENDNVNVNGSDNDNKNESESDNDNDSDNDDNDDGDDDNDHDEQYYTIKQLND